MANPRKEILTTNEIYHVYNKSIANEDIFSNIFGQKRTLELINFYRFTPILRYSKFKQLPKTEREQFMSMLKHSSALIEIYAYAIMNNHYHLLVRQLKDRGITTFVSNFQNSYAKYVNLKSKRTGAVFLKPFKAKRIESEEILLHISRYIHLNPVTSFLIDYENLKSYLWNSYGCYLGKHTNTSLNINFILNIIGSVSKYESFVQNQVDYQKNLKIIKSLVLE